MSLQSHRIVYSPTSGTSRALETAVERVSSGWLPANPGVLEKIRAGLSTGSYDLDPEFLINDLKGDISLLLYCVRELSRTTPSSSHDPLHSLRRSNVEMLKNILPQTANELSFHSIEDADAFQTARMQEALLSASTAEVLAERNEIDPASTFCTGLLRQLGLTLIAWNYPDAYARSLEAVKRGKSLDLALSQNLGFSPETLAIALVRRWGLNPTIERALVKNPMPDSARLNDPGDHIAELCQVGELLARANDPASYPSAKRDWEEARAFLRETLGTDGLHAIRDRFNQNCEQYASAFPTAFAPLTRLDPESSLKHHSDKTLLVSNPYVKQCSPIVRKRLTDLYELMLEKRDVQEVMRILVKEILPVAGFSGGIIYTFDPQLNMLMPRLRFGDVLLRNAEPVTMRYDGAAPDEIHTAFECQTPIMERAAFTSTVDVGFMAAALGSVRRVGVFYAEFSGGPVTDHATNPMITFKALRQAVQNVLGLQ